MRHDDEIDEAALLRYAVLGDDGEETARRIAVRIRGGDTALARRLAALREVRDVVRSDALEGPSPDALARVRGLVREAHPLPPRESWVVARPRAEPAGVRGPSANTGTLFCETESFLLSVALRGSRDRRRCAVEGQVVAHDGAPVHGAWITWIVDGFGLSRAVTDENGEFSFDETEGGSFGLRIDSPGPVCYVSLRDGGSD